jgi:hypothetical protein
MESLAAPAAPVNPKRPPRRHPPRRPQRHVRILRRPEFAPNVPGLIEVTVGSDVTRYALAYVPSDFGDGFRFAKQGGDGAVYHVHLSDEWGRTCECLGFLAHGHCKHVDLAVRLRELRKL